MGKYEPLGQFLRKQHRDRVQMTFAEIERVLGQKLPASKQHRAWWSNNPNNNVMTKYWLDAGFKTSDVDTASERLVFRRDRAPSKPTSVSDYWEGLKSLKGMITIVDAESLTQPVFEEADWDVDNVARGRSANEHN